MPAELTPSASAPGSGPRPNPTTNKSAHTRSGTARRKRRRARAAGPRAPPAPPRLAGIQLLEELRRDLRGRHVEDDPPAAHADDALEALQGQIHVVHGGDERPSFRDREEQIGQLDREPRIE